MRFFIMNSSMDLEKLRKNIMENISFFVFFLHKIEVEVADETTKQCWIFSLTVSEHLRNTLSSSLVNFGFLLRFSQKFRK